MPLLFLEGVPWYDSFMKRIRALLLLIVLLGSKIAPVAQATCGSTALCCAGDMCPVHQSHQDRGGLQSKAPCDHMKGSDCLCYSNNSAKNKAEKVATIAVDKAVLDSPGPMPAPQNSRIAGVGFFASILSGFVLPSERPPRS